MWDHPDGVKSLIRGAGPGICTHFLFVRYIYVRLYVSLGCIHGFLSVYWRFRACIWNARCSSAVTDVAVDYLTDFYNKYQLPSL